MLKASSAFLPEGMTCYLPSDTPNVLYDNLFNWKQALEFTELFDYLAGSDTANSSATHILVSGKEGNGKRTMVRAVAHKARLPLYAFDASVLDDSISSVRIVENIFNLSDDNYILEIDNYDSLYAIQSDELYNTFKDSISTHHNVIIVATSVTIPNKTSVKSNRYLGFFGKFVKVFPPTHDMYIKLITEFAKPYTIDDNVDLNNLVNGLVSASIADIENLITCAIANAKNDSRYNLTIDDLGSYLMGYSDFIPPFDWISFTTPLSKPRVLYKDLILKSAIEPLSFLAHSLICANHYEGIKHEPERFMLMLGGHGTGKSTIINAFAHQLHLPLYTFSVADLLSEEDIEDVIAKVFSIISKPYVLYITDMDLFDVSDESDPICTKQLISSFEKTAKEAKNVILFASSEGVDEEKGLSYVYNLFNKIITLSFPTFEERIAAFKEFCNPFKLEKGLKYENVANLFSTATINDIKYISNSVIGRAVACSRNYLTANDFAAEFPKDTEEEPQEYAVKNVYKIPSDRKPPAVKFADYVQKGISDELLTLIEYIKKHKGYRNSISSPDSRILFYGDPDSGKDTLIQAFAYEVKLPIYYVDASEIILSEKCDEAIKAIFELQKDRYVLVINSFESLATGSLTLSSARVINILSLLENATAKNPNVILFVTMEILDVLFDDSHVLERINKMFKKRIYMVNPIQSERIEYLKCFTKSLKLDSDVDFNSIANFLYGYNVGQIKYVVKEAIGISKSENRTILKHNDFLLARDRIEYGNTTYKVQEDTRRNTAYHEAGHAVVNYVLKGKDSVLRVIATGRGNYGGYTWPLYEEGKMMTRKDMLDDIYVDYGGMCAEKIVFDYQTYGPYYDLQHATGWMLYMIQDLGMSEEVGCFSASTLEACCGPVQSMNEAIYREVKKLSHQCVEKTMQILNENRDLLEALADYLLKYEAIDCTTLTKLFEDVISNRNKA